MRSQCITRLVDPGPGRSHTSPRTLIVTDSEQNDTPKHTRGAYPQSGSDDTVEDFSPPSPRDATQEDGAKKSHPAEQPASDSMPAYGTPVDAPTEVGSSYQGSDHYGTDGDAPTIESDAYKAEPKHGSRPLPSSSVSDPNIKTQVSPSHVSEEGSDGKWVVLFVFVSIIVLLGAVTIAFILSR